MGAQTSGYHVNHSVSIIPKADAQFQCSRCRINYEIGPNEGSSACYVPTLVVSYLQDPKEISHPCDEGYDMEVELMCSL